MTTHPIRLCLWGWPLPPVKVVAGLYCVTVVDAINQALERTQRRVSMLGFTGAELLPADWQPLGGAQGPGWPFWFVVKWNPDYCGNGTAAVHNGAGLSIVEGSSLDLDRLNERDRSVMVNTHVHEFGHLCGCALGEMYDFGRYAVLHNNEFVILDTTGLGPRCDLRIHDPGNELFAHPSRADWLRDPMVRNDGTEFCEMNRAIIDGDYSLSRAPRPDANVELIVNGVDQYEWSLWRQEPAERIYNTDTRQYEDGEPARQERMPMAAPGDGLRAFMSMLKAGEHPDTLSSYDLFLVKLSGPWGAHAFWFSTWDFIGIDEAKIELTITRPLQLPPAPMIQPRLLKGVAVFDAAGKPIVIFRVEAEPSTALNIQSATNMAGPWKDHSVFVKEPGRNLVLPNRKQQEFFRVQSGSTPPEPALLALADRITTAGAARLAATARPALLPLAVRAAARSLRSMQAPAQPWPRCECRTCRNDSNQ